MRIFCSPDMDITPVHCTFDVESRITENGSCRQILTSLARSCRMYIIWPDLLVSEPGKTEVCTGS